MDTMSWQTRHISFFIQILTFQQQIDFVRLAGSFKVNIILWALLRCLGFWDSVALHQRRRTWWLLELNRVRLWGIFLHYEGCWGYWWAISGYWQVWRAKNQETGWHKLDIWILIPFLFIFLLLDYVVKERKDLFS